MHMLLLLLLLQTMFLLPVKMVQLVLIKNEGENPVQKNKAKAIEGENDEYLKYLDKLFYFIYF